MVCRMSDRWGNSRFSALEPVSHRGRNEAWQSGRSRRIDQIGTTRTMSSERKGLLALHERGRSSANGSAEMSRIPEMGSESAHSPFHRVRLARNGWSPISVCRTPAIQEVPIGNPVRLETILRVPPMVIQGKRTASLVISRRPSASAEEKLRRRAPTSPWVFPPASPFPSFSSSHPAPSSASSWSP